MGQQGSTEAAGAGAGGASGGASAQRAVPQKGMMRAWVMETPGDIDELSPKDNITVPTPGPGEVRVKVMAAGLNMSDVRRVREAGMAFPAAVGLDGAGIVDAVGPEAAGGDVARPEVGTRVYFTCDSALAYGTLAEYTIVSAHRVFPVLGEVSFATAAALPSSGWAAYLAIREKLQVSRGKSIYITGGAGGVGGYAVSLCKGEGLTVITSCSSYNTPYALERGADHVLDYTSDDIAAEVARLTDGRGVDYVLDTIGSETATANARLLAHNGQICSTNGPVMFTEDLVLRGTSVHYIYLNGLLESPHHRAVVKDIADTVMQLTATGELRSNVGEVGKWDRVREALHALESRHVRGKLVISIEPLHRARAKAESAQAAGTAEEYVVVSSAAELESMLVGNAKLVSTESVLATAGKRCHIVERDGDVVRVLHENLHCWLPMSALTKVCVFGFGFVFVFVFCFLFFVVVHVKRNKMPQHKSPQVSDDAAPADSASAEAAPSADSDCSRKPSGDGVPPPVAPSPSIATTAEPAANPQADAAKVPATTPAAPLPQPAVKQPPQQLPTQPPQLPVKPSYPSYAQPPQPPQPPQGLYNPRGAAGGIPHQSYGHSAAPVTTAPAASNPAAPQQPGKVHAPAQARNATRQHNTTQHNTTQHNTTQQQQQQGSYFVPQAYLEHVQKQKLAEEARLRGY